jgi:hypothetical protein
MTIVAAAWSALAPARADALASIYFRSMQSATTSTGTTINLTAPANIAVGDLLLLDVDCDGGTVTVPSGWTPILTPAFAGAQNNVQNTYNSSVYSTLDYRVATAADVSAASYALSFSSGSTHAVARMMDYVGTSASPFGSLDDNAGPGSNSVTYAYLPSSSLTPSVGDLVAFGIQANTSSGTITVTSNPTGSTARLDTSSGGNPNVTGYNADLIATSTSPLSPTSSLSASANWGASIENFHAAASGSLAFGTAPALPTSIGTVALNGQAQTLTTQMNDFDIDDTTGTGSGWNVTVQGQTGAGNSPVFAQYCPTGGGCGTVGYVGGGASLPANSLTLNSTGATFSTTGGAGTTPTLSCASGCSLDSSTALKIASAAVGAGKGPWVTSGFGASSLSLAIPTTTKVLPAGEVYQVNLLFTLGSGP